MGKIIDVSHHQGNVDWKKAKADVDLAIIRVQYGSSTIDRKYKEYVKGCKENGIPFGHYAYALFVSVNDAIVEAKDFMERADKDAKFLVVDVEEVTTKKASDMLPATQAFVDTLKAKGWKVGLYTGHHFYKPHKMDKVTGYDFLWIPRYYDVKPDYKCDLWQSTDRGKVKGFGGNVDLNKLNGSKDLDWFIGSEVPKQVVKKVVKPTVKKVVKEPVKAKTKQVQVTASVLNVRAGASNKDRIIGTVKKGEKFRYGMATKGDWYNIYYGKSGGWVHSKYVKFI